MDNKFTFLHLEWEGCPVVEVDGDGKLLVDGVEVGEEEFALSLAGIAQRWRAEVEQDIGRSQGWHQTAVFIQGPLSPPPVSLLTKRQVL